MSYADYCDIGESSTFYKESFPAGKKDYRCCECSKTIPKGDTHLSCSGLFDGAFWSERQCLDCRDFCMEIRDRLMEGRACLSFGELDQFLTDNAFSIDTDTKRDKKKFARVRSLVAIWKWDNEKSRKPFWKPRYFPRRKAIFQNDEWNLSRGFTA